MKTIKHKFHINPLPAWECKTLILGTFNPEIGSNADYYYGRLRKTGGWSNRFWPAINSYLKTIFSETPLAERGNLDSKINILKFLNIGCIDIIYSVKSQNIDEIIGQGFSDKAIFKQGNIIHFNTKLIINYINENDIKKVISSFGIGTSLNKIAKNEITKIIKSCPKSDFQLFNLPAFGRPMMPTEMFGDELFIHFI